MGRKINEESHILTAAFSPGLAAGLRQRELNKGDRKFLRQVVGLSDHDVAHIARESRPDVKAYPQRIRDFHHA